MDHPLVREAQPHECVPVASLLARAFTDDAYLALLSRDAKDPLAARAHYFRHLYAACTLRFVVDDLSAAALWMPPDARPTLAATIAMIPLAWHFGWRKIFTSYFIHDAIDKARPSEAHYYLLAVGVDEARRGSGLARAVLAPMLQRCDAENVRAYLETSHRENCALYERLGFVVRAEVFPRGKKISPFWGMWRAPRRTP